MVDNLIVEVNLDRINRHDQAKAKNGTSSRKSRMNPVSKKTIKTKEKAVKVEPLEDIQNKSADLGD